MSKVNMCHNCVPMPIYSLWLMGVTIVAMLIAIVILSLALYMKTKNKRIVGISTLTNSYVKEQTMEQTQYDYNEEYNKDDVSTLTVNSGSIMEINRLPEPVPTTRTDDSKIILTRKPFRPMSPIIQRGQMDEICKEVLKRVQKSDSASFRDLNALLNSKNDEKVEPKNEFLNELDKKLIIRTPINIKREFKRQSRLETKEEAKNQENKETKNEIKSSLPDDKKDSTKDIIKEIENNHKKGSEKDGFKESLIDITEQLYVNKKDDEVETKVGDAIKIEVQNVSVDEDFEESGPETEYDTVPSPVRCRSSADIGDDFDVDSIPVYDLPPRRSYEGHTRNMIHLDNDTQYLIPITSVQTDSCYINAKRQSKDKYKRSTSDETPRSNTRIDL